MGEVEELKHQVRELTEKLSFFENNLKNAQKDIIKQALEEFTEQKKKDPLKSEFDRKFKRNKKNLIKQKIIDAAKTKPTPVADLKYYIVDQLSYCSKASFYRYIEEMYDQIEIKDKVIYIKEQILV